MVISGVGSSWGLFSTQSECIWLGGLIMRIKMIASSNWIGSNFRPFWGHTVVTDTKDDQFWDSPPPETLHLFPPFLKISNKSQYIFHLRAKVSADMWKIIRPPPPSIFLLFWKKLPPCCQKKTSQLSKYCLKTFLSPKIVDLQSK